MCKHTDTIILMTILNIHKFSRVNAYDSIFCAPLNFEWPTLFNIWLLELM